MYVCICLTIRESSGKVKVCLYVSLFVCPPIYISSTYVYLFVFVCFLSLSAYLSFCLSVCFFFERIFLYVFLFICSSVCVSIFVLLYRSTHFCLSVHLYLSLSIFTPNTFLYLTTLRVSLRPFLPSTSSTNIPSPSTSPLYNSFPFLYFLQTYFFFLLHHLTHLFLRPTTALKNTHVLSTVEITRSDKKR